MDISAFSDDNFEVKDWINQTFRTAEAQENKDAFVSSLVMKLQLCVQQVNSALEDTSQLVLQGLPRVMRDTKMLNQEALMLREKMQTIKLEIAKVEKDTGDSMASLEKIDRIKTELQMAKDALHEADNWTLLAADIEEVFETKNVEEISSKLVSMQQSLSILANASDYDDRKLQLEGLKNRLEAIASPQLVQAFTSGSIEQSCKFVEIFSGMERLPQLIKYYDRCQKGTLCQHWRSLIEVEQDQTVTEWMHHFYDYLLSNWHKQVKWCNQVFKQANSLTDVYIDVLLSLEPSLNECIEAAVKQQPQQLPFLAELKQISKNFSNNLQIAASAQCKTKESWENMLRAIFSPYIPFMTRYNALEEAHILSQLIEHALSREDIMDQVQGLGQSIQRCLSIAVDAIKRCESFTEGCGFPGLIKALKVYFGSYLEQYNSILQQLEHKKSEHDNWNLFQMCLTLLQTAGELLTEIKRLDQELIQNIIDSSRKETFSEFVPVLLLPSTQQEVKDLVVGIQDGTYNSLLESAILSVEKFCRDVHFTTYKVIFNPVSVQLDSASAVWSTAQNSSFNQDLPDYSFAPQEYITQVGEYLMTLPQHLEPFLLKENASLISALQVQTNEGREGEGFADLLLGMVARGTCQMYLDQILAIRELNTAASKQLATDINYLGNVLEDLGFELSESLQQISTLLRITPENYHEHSKGSQPRLVAAVRQMRNITSN